MKRILRSLLALLFFAGYGVGSLLFLPLLVCIPQTVAGHRFCRRVVRAFYRLFVWLADRTGLFHVKIDDSFRAHLATLRGCVIVATHPSLIDVVILMALLGDTTALAKMAAARNPFYALIVRRLFLVTDDIAHLRAEAVTALRQGINVIVFPEGTRTSAAEQGGTLHRGAAHFALSAGTPIQCVKLRCEPPVLARGMRAWDVGDHAIIWYLEDAGIIPADKDSSSPVTTARALTAEIYRRIKS